MIRRQNQPDPEICREKDCYFDLTGYTGSRYMCGALVGFSQGVAVHMDKEV